MVVVVVVVCRIICGNAEERVFFFSRINLSHFLLTPRKISGCILYFTVLY